MERKKNSETLIPAEDSPYRLKYEPSEVEGECLLESIVPVKKSMPFFVLYVILSIAFAGLPLLITYWYPWLKRKIYYNPCPLEDATDFHIINYDGVSTYPDKLEKEFYYTSSNVQRTILFENRYLTYLVVGDLVKAACYDFVSRVNEIMSHPLPDKKSYVTESDVPNLKRSYGPGVMKIEMPNIFMLFLQEVMRPLYLFIVFSTILWYTQEYTYYASVIIGTAALGVLTNLYQTYHNNKRIHEMAYHEEKIQTLRSGEVIEISSTELVPGDIVFVKNQIKIPFDGVILECEALINECALTGESVPILKKPEPIGKIEDIKTSYIFEGTNLIQIGNKKKSLKFDHYREKYGVPILVARTNFSTMKGQLIRVISFPKERENIFERQSTKFLLFLFCLAIISYGILISKLRGIVDGETLFLKFLDLITITVPPGLPVSMTFGIIFALDKMKKKSIYCSSPNKVIHGGLTNWLCFDKTGTLTEDFMDFHCLILHDGKHFCEPIMNFESTKAEQDKEAMLTKSKKLNSIIEKNEKVISALNNMAMNHTIVNLQETGENVGDPMEIKLFEFGEFKFSNEQSDNSNIIMAFDSNRGHKGFVYKRFDFDSQLFRMSAIGKTNYSGNQYHLYIKGSPELMIDIFKPETIPANYTEILKQYTSQGYRVLAIGCRQVDESALNLSRLELEREINFEGFEVFENKLKPETKGAITELIDAELPCVMITGDNALTGSNMAYQCGISDPTKKTLICNYNSQKNEFSIEEFVFQNNGGEIPIYKERKVVSLNFESPSSSVESVERINVENGCEIQSITNSEVEKDKQKVVEMLKNPDVQLCITGPALNRIFDMEHQTLNKVEEYILLRTTVFARAKPNDKIKAISLYQKLGKIVSMCGDGANDCGALKQADIGLSLSMAEASISAPFTSQITNISSMVELLKECRAGLATNYSLFNIMALYSLIQYTTTIMTQFYFSYPGDFQYLYWDIFCNFLFFLTIGYTGTAKKLSVEIPKGSLFTISNMTQVLVMFGLQLMGQFLMLFAITQPFQEEIGHYDGITYEAFLEEEDFVTVSYENNILFLFTNIMYIFTLLAFSISKPWRKHFYTNPLFMIVLALVLVYSLVIIVVPKARLDLFEVEYMDYQPLNWYIFGLALGIGVVIYVLQKFILEPLFNWIGGKYPHIEWI